MSKIALNSNASGSGVFTIESPNSDTDRTLNLPDKAGTVQVGEGIDDNATSTAITIDSSENVSVGGDVTVTGSLLAKQSGAGSAAFAAGTNAGATSQGNYGTAVGGYAGETSQAQSATAIGMEAGRTSQGLSGTAVGNHAGKTTQGNYGTAVGIYAGSLSQGASATAVGNTAGYNTQGSGAVAVGQNAGSATQGNDSVAVGNSAGQTTQGDSAVAVGYVAGYANQGANATALGRGAGYSGQGGYATAVGRDTAVFNQGSSSVAIGYLAGYQDQAANGIIINSRGSSVTSLLANHIYITSSSTKYLYYNGSNRWDIAGGSLYVSGSFVSSSDQTLKGNITTAPSDMVGKLTGREWDWKSNGEKGSGVVAQELEEHLPHLVVKNDEGIKGVNYSGLSGYLIEAIKEQKAMIETLQAEVAELKGA